MAIVLNYGWPQPPDKGSKDYWKDSETRALADRAASFLEGGTELEFGPTSGPGLVTPKHGPSATVPPVDPAGG